MRSFSGFLTLMAAAVLIAGCGSYTQTDNAVEFRDKISKTSIAYRLEPEREGRPGIVQGKAATEAGTVVNFVFSFGPAPEMNLPPPAKIPDAVWFPKGDKVYYWVSKYPPGTPDAEQDRALSLGFALGNVACQVVADQNCDF